MTTTPPSKARTLLSGMQPTGGGGHLGNYIGAIKNWVELQKTYRCIFAVVDLHSITVKQDPAQLREASYRTAATYFASGVDPKKSLVFIQSHVPQHAELGWVLTCFTNMGELNRMTQFKDKSAKSQVIPTGLFVYPSLMAADILLYQAHLVPVGHDQKQHLELARDLAGRLNHLYGPLFQIPEPFIPTVGARIMSLQDASKKMSKSDEDTMATIFVTDSDDVIMKKFKRAVTDSLNEIKLSDDQPGIKNLVTIQAAISGQTPEKIIEGLAGKQYGFLKMQTAEMVIELVKPFRLEIDKMMNDKTFLNQALKSGAEQAQALAQETLTKLYDALGFIPRG